MNRGQKLLMLIPAFNEEAAVAGVVEEVRTVMPGVPVLVVDDCSEDGTIDMAQVGRRESACRCRIIWAWADACRPATGWRSNSATTT